MPTIRTLRALILLLPLAIAATGTGRSQARTIYATVHGNPKYLVGSSTLHSGLYRSSDAGRTWEQLGPRNLKAYSMDAIDSSRGRILFIAAGNGVHKSTDYGRTWRITTDWRITEVMDVKVDQHNPARVFAATAFGLWQSDDAGETWTNPEGMLKERYIYRIDPIGEDGEITLSGADAVYVSFDRGASWSIQLETPSPRGLYTVGTYGKALAGSKGPIWYAGTGQADVNQRVGASSPEMSTYSITHRNDTVFLGGSLGVWYLGVESRSVAWRKINFDLPNYIVHAIVATPDVILAGTFGNGLFRLEGNSWKPSGLEGAQVWNLVAKEW